MENKARLGKFRPRRRSKRLAVEPGLTSFRSRAIRANYIPLNTTAPSPSPHASFPRMSATLPSPLSPVDPSTVPESEREVKSSWLVQKLLGSLTGRVTIASFESLRSS